MRYTLNKNERLKSRKKIEHLFKTGKSINAFPVRMLYVLSTNETSDNTLLAGFSASTKNFKKAVDRNRIKRLLREAYRLQKTELEKQLKSSNKNISLFFIYSGTELPEYKLIYEKVQTLIKRLQKNFHENSTATS
ncbi:ribonuclease P protein component [Ferruginibacter albus]|nr:ribonuclease P protein component [Ferruginibacter albus]